MNTKLCWYFARRILIRTNNISSNYLKLMPIIFPKKNNEKKRISNKTEEIVKKLQINLNFDTKQFEEEMDNVFFDIYEINENDKNRIIKFTNNFYDDM
jgi:spore coat polysaccharide biosynthesis predicted glycosyltransferase SpsG